MTTKAEKYPRAKGRIFVISSPSGGGKTTVVDALLRRVPWMVRSMSVTTRQRRPSEKHGRDYRFISVAQFEKLRDEGELLEWARVHEAHYGTPRTLVEQQLARGQDVILSIDVQGARQIRGRFGQKAVLVFLLPPSMKDLRQRLIKRQTETMASIRQRLDAAHQELACAEWYDYAVVNRSLDRAIAQLEAIVVAERLRIPSSSERR